MSENDAAKTPMSDHLFRIVDLIYEGNRMSFESPDGLSTSFISPEVAETVALAIEIMLRKEGLSSPPPKEE